MFTSYYTNKIGLISESKFLSHYEEMNLHQLIDINKIIVLSNGPYNTPQNIQVSKNIISLQ
jgi:hypothetical protein